MLENTLETNDEGELLDVYVDALSLKPKKARYAQSRR